MAPQGMVMTTTTTTVKQPAQAQQQTSGGSGGGKSGQDYNFGSLKELDESPNV